MTTFSPEQSAVFNQVRYDSDKRKEIADEIAQRRAEIEKHQGKIQGIAGKIVQEQAEVVGKQTRVAIEQEKVAQEQAEIAQEQTEIAHEQAAIAQEQAEIARERTEILQEQTEIQELEGTITELSTVDTRLQTNVVGALDHLDEYGALKPVLLEFDDACQTIRWGNDCSVRLTKSQYDIVDILYHAPACQMSITSLDERVWGKGMMPTEDAVRMPTHDAARMAISRLNRELKTADFPFEVLRIKRDIKTVPTENPVTKEQMDVLVHPEIEIYALVRK